MRRIQIIRIVLLLVAIFAGGVVTGRLTTRGSPTYVKNAAGRYNTAETMLGRLTREVGLDPKQQEQSRALLEETAEGMARFEPASQERFDLFRSFTQRQRALLRPDQYPAFDKLVQQTERRFEQTIKRKAARRNK